MATVTLLADRRAAREYRRVFWAEVAAEVARRERELCQHLTQLGPPRLRVVR